MSSRPAQATYGDSVFKKKKKIGLGVWLKSSRAPPSEQGALSSTLSTTKNKDKKIKNQIQSTVSTEHV
jgi:hypothetical protein